MPQSRSNPWLVLLVLVTGFFMIMLDTTIVNVAIPAMSAGLNTTLDQILWVLNAYILVYAVLLITAGRLGDLYGQRNLFVPPARRGASCGVWGGVAGLATIAGPTVGGALVTYVDWRWIFFVNVPIGIVALIATFAIIPDVRPGRRHGWDFMGVFLSTAGLFAVVFGLIEGQRFNWGEIGSYGITIPEVIIGGGVLIALFIVWERFQAEPLMPLSLFRDRNFAVANWIAAAISFGMLSLFLPLVIYLQTVRGFSALTSGLTFAPMSLTSMVVAPFAGRFADKVGGKYILLTGISLFTIGFGLVAIAAGPDSTWATFLGPAIVAGAGMGMTFAPMTTVAMRNISPQMSGAASGILNTTRQLGAAIGSAVVGALLQNQLATTLHNQAVNHASALPADYRAQFIAAFSSVASNGFQIGTGQTGAKLPSGLPPAAQHQLAALAHDVFVSGYIDAMKGTLLVPLVFLGFTALTPLLIKRRQRPAARQGEPAQAQEKVAAAAV